MGGWYRSCKVFCSLIICNLRKIVKNSIQGPNLFKRISSGITAFLFILCVLAFYTLYKIVSFLVDRPSLPTKDFYTFGGTTTALLPVGDDVYMTVVSRTLAGVHAARSGDYTDILKISRKDFLAKRSAFERVARVEGQITVAALSHDGTTLYFFQRPPSEPGEAKKELFCGFDLKTGVISHISEESASVGLRLVDVDGKYLLLYWSTYAGASLDGGRTWHTLLHAPCVTFADGALYLVRDDALLVLPGEAIMAGTFQEEKLRDLEPGMKIDSLLVDKDHVAHLSGSRGKTGAAADKERRGLCLISLDGSPAVSFPALRVGKAYSLSELYFAHGKDIYCRMSGADTPFARETRLLQISGDAIRRSKAFEESPDLLGTLGDYLIFNVDAVWQRKSFLFGIKYT